MSLPPVRDKTESETKTVSIIGTEKDMQALGDVLKQAKDMFNIDLNLDNNDMPERLTFRDLEILDAIAYPRTARVLRQTSDGLRATATRNDIIAPVSTDFGNLDWLAQKPQNNFMIIKALQSVMNGRSIQGSPSLPAVLSSYGSITADLETMINRPYPPNMVYNVNTMGLFTHYIKPEWVKIQTVDVNPTTSERYRQLINANRPEQAEEERIAGTAAYPADLTRIDASSRGRGGVVPTQAYYAAFRGSAAYDLQQRVNISRSQWDAFLRKYPRDILANEQRSAPRNVGDLIETLMVINVASIMNMKRATVRPIIPTRPCIEVKAYDWVEPVAAGQRPTRIPKTGVLYSTIVIGTGRPPQMGQGYDVGTINSIRQIPGWF